MTSRNTPSLLDALPDGVDAVFHFDGEFATADELVCGTFLGRNYGWLASERAEAVRHVADVIRNDRSPTVSYGRTLLKHGGCDVTRASDAEVVEACAHAVVAYLRTLRFSRDQAGQFNGSPYDAFLAANRLPLGPAKGETDRSYSRRLSELIAVLPHPVFVAAPERRLRSLDQPFVFGPEELRGCRIFFKAAVGSAQQGGAGNCAECHVPPRFTDFGFHNTGVAQDEYDAVHGAGAFARLPVPTLAERGAAGDRWLEQTPFHPAARGALALPPLLEDSTQADIGLWNVYANHDFPAVQPALERLLNPAGQRPSDVVLVGCIGAFKTSGLRGLGASAPYLHTGEAKTLADVVALYRRASEWSRTGKLRNSPPEFFAMRLLPEDVAPLVAFLRALNEEVVW